MNKKDSSIDFSIISQRTQQAVLFFLPRSLCFSRLLRESGVPVHMPPCHHFSVYLQNTGSLGGTMLLNATRQSCFFIQQHSLSHTHGFKSSNLAHLAHHGLWPEYTVQHCILLCSVRYPPQSSFPSSNNCLNAGKNSSARLKSPSFTHI